MSLHDKEGSADGEVNGKLLNVLANNEEHVKSFSIGLLVIWSYLFICLIGVYTCSAIVD